MFYEMKRADKALPENEALEILSTAEYGVLSTIGENGYPYGVPVNFVYDDGKIYFHTAKEGHKIDNIRNNEHASFCVVTDTQVLPDAFNTKFRSVIAYGKIAEVSEEEKQKIFVKIMEKFSADFMDSAMDYVRKASPDARIFALNIEHMTAKGKK